MGWWGDEAWLEWSGVGSSGVELGVASIRWSGSSFSLGSHRHAAYTAPSWRVSYTLSTPLYPTSSALAALVLSGA